MRCLIFLSKETNIMIADATIEEITSEHNLLLYIKDI
jgi:hypothetical protein